MHTVLRIRGFEVSGRFRGVSIPSRNAPSGFEALEGGVELRGVVCQHDIKEAQKKVLVII